MKATDRSILLGVALLVMMAGFWFLILSPKREEASTLEGEISTLQAAVAQQEQIVADARLAEDEYDSNYRSLVVLGKAVPSDSDTSSLFLQLDELATSAGVSLAAIELSEGSGAAAPTPPPAPAETDADPKAEPTGEDAAPTIPVAAAPAAPTEAAAADLPLGATVGPAGLPVMPYTLEVQGSFFQLADFVKSMDDLVGYANGTPDVRGRLLTIDGFKLEPADPSVATTSVGDALMATFSITSYISPAEQGLTAGATPAGPAPVPASTPVSSSPTPTATVTP